MTAWERAEAIVIGDGPLNREYRQLIAEAILAHAEDMRTRAARVATDLAAYTMPHVSEAIRALSLDPEET